MREKLERILVVSRMSKNCQKAVHAGISLAHKYGAELYVMHVLHDPFGLGGWNLPQVSVEENYQSVREEVKADLAALLASEATEGLKVHELIRDGEPTAEIIKVVEEEKINLLVMLAHEEGRLEHFLFGRSNEALIRKMPCSILMVKDELVTV